MRKRKNKKQQPRPIKLLKSALLRALSCVQCTLKKTDACQAALQVKRKGKDGKEVTRVVLLKNNDVTQAFHKKICGGDKIAVAVTGKLEGKGKERVIVASKIADPPPAKKGKGKKKA